MERGHAEAHRLLVNVTATSRDMSVWTKLAFEGLSHFVRGCQASLPSTGCGTACGFRARSPGSQVLAEPCLPFPASA